VKPKVAIVHDWLITIGGAEKVLRQLVIMYPEADIFCLFNFFNQQQREEILLGRNTKSTFLEHVPFSKKHYRHMVPIFYKAVERLDVSGYDIVISSSHAVAKGVITRMDQLHFCYCHTPMRYVWNMKKTYLSQIPDRYRKLASGLFRRMKEWDLSTSEFVDQFIANSKFVQERIRINYQKDSIVINPPVDTEFFNIDAGLISPESKPYFLIVSRLVFYKRIDLAIEAFNEMPDRQLVIIGSGPERERLEAMSNLNTTFLNFQSSERIRQYMQHAEASIFSAIEDFGITCLEVQACGTPVLAYDFGGYKETVVHGETGLLFKQQTKRSIMDVIDKLQALPQKLNPVQIRENSLKYGHDRFRTQIKELIESRVNLSDEQV
jgi:glycosyltransferase involved in cell wall biosynthesis